ncbi:glycosyltransferase family 9 protein [Pigmentiphaga soli]|uniref:Glycosyltransferase family 9 protein n=1 Tax=Pigmentiphaga soli TaxID=1007095 RepID=A0ABP8GBV7_9BURK
MVSRVFGGLTGVVMPHAIGDSLYLCVLLRNLLSQGARLELVGGVIAPLRDWFPYASHLFVPDPPAADVAGALARYDRIVQMYPRRVAGEYLNAGNLVSLIHQPHFGKRIHILDSLLMIGGDMGLAGELSRDCGMRPPAARALRFRHFPERVVIHPTASNDFKAWGAGNFVDLAHALERWGLDPCLVVSPSEWPAWKAHAGRVRIEVLPDLADLAALIYESGWFIGNDSGVGHLASALGLPTLSLFPRNGLARRWRPAWGRNRVVLPLPLVFPTVLKERYWRQLLPVSRVLRAFDALQAEVAGLGAHCLFDRHLGQRDRHALFDG